MTENSSYFNNSRMDASVIQTLFAGKLGCGIHRTVYALAHNPTKVCKVELNCGSFANVEEHNVWQRLKDTKWSKWLAPVHSIDPWGAVLIQERTTPITNEQWINLKRLPNFITDLKKSNFGMLDGRIVAHDYGLNLINEIGFPNFRVVNKPSYANSSSRL